MLQTCAPDPSVMILEGDVLLNDDGVPMMLSPFAVNGNSVPGPLSFTEFLNSLEKDHCHTFLLQHPESKLRFKGVPVVFHLNKVNLVDFTEKLPEKENLTINSLPCKFHKKNKFMVFCKRDGSVFDRIKEFYVSEVSKYSQAVAFQAQG